MVSIRKLLVLAGSDSMRAGSMHSCCMNEIGFELINELAAVGFANLSPLPNASIYSTNNSVTHITYLVAANRQ